MTSKIYYAILFSGGYIIYKDSFKSNKNYIDISIKVINEDAYPKLVFTFGIQLIDDQTRKPVPIYIESLDTYNIFKFLQATNINKFSFKMKTYSNDIIVVEKNKDFVTLVSESNGEVKHSATINLMDFKFIQFMMKRFLEMSTDFKNIEMFFKIFNRKD